MRFLLILFFSCLSFTSFTQLDSSIKDIGVYVSSGEDAIYANLLLPSEASSIVLFIAGSGPIDNNGNNPLGMSENYSYKMFAHQLFNNNIASLRYDKRGIAKSKNAFFNQKPLRFSYLVDDVLALLKFIRAQYPEKKIIIVGHSQGSLLGMLAAQKTESLAAFISISGAGFSIDQILKQQFESQPPFFKKYFYQVIDSLKMGHQMDTIYPPMPLPTNLQQFMIDWMTYDPVLEISKLRVPILVINGTHDIQVGEDNAIKLVSRNEQCTLKLIDGMSHVLKPAPKDKNQNIKTYNNKKTPLHPDLIPVVVEFINSIE